MATVAVYSNPNYKVADFTDDNKSCVCFSHEFLFHDEEKLSPLPLPLPLHPGNF